VREFTERVSPPRTVFLRWPFGHPLGEPFNPAQQRTVLMEAFKALFAIRNPGTIIDLPYRWRKEKYDNWTGNRISLETTDKMEYNLVRGLKGGKV
jgi:D-proline reductase (dithiol) PrdB